MTEFGKPTHFDLEHALKTAQMLVDSDNVVGAFKFVDECFPAYYREGQHDLIELWKHNVRKRIATINDYASGEMKEIRKEFSLQEFKALRFQAVDQLVAHWNAQEREPYIVDLGPGEYTLPIGLKENGRKFTYKPIAITSKVPPQAMKHIEDVYAIAPKFHQPQIFTCFEMIEHSFHPDDIADYYHRENINAEHVLISTPYGALGGGWNRVHADIIAHVKDFNKKELIAFAMKHWPWLKWEYIHGPQMLVMGNRINA